jgi:electron transfer flavoprotein-quinone oxidoreductase
MDGSSCFAVDFKSDHFSDQPHSGLIVLRSRFDEWLARRVQDAIEESGLGEESFLATNVLVEEVLQRDGRVTGIRAGGEEFESHVVILAEGVNNLLTRQIGLQSAYVPADHMAVGVKEVIGLDRVVIEDRFQLDGLAGTAAEFVGDATSGVEGGGFVYTNRESLSVGLVLGMADLRDKRLKPYDVLTSFKEHPTIRDMVRGGTTVEYSAHAVSSGVMGHMPERYAADGVLLTGEAGHLLLNAGRAIQGMDYAMHSGILAAEAVLQAREDDDFSASSLARYEQALKSSYVWSDMTSFQGAVELLHDPAIRNAVPDLLCEFGREFFTIDNEPTARARKLFTQAVGHHSSLLELAKLGIRAMRHL